MKPVIVTAAAHSELALLNEALKGGGPLTAGRLMMREGFVGERCVLVTATGIGKVNAASAATVLLERFVPELLINIGCAGAYAESGLVKGDLALATAEVFGDEGVVTPDGWHSMDLIGIPVVTVSDGGYFNRFPMTRWALDEADRVADEAGIILRRGEFVTVSTVSGTAGRGSELFRRFGGICENMEGAAVAQVASLYGVDCMEIRGVSNLVVDRDLSLWDIPLAAEQAQKFVLRFIGEMNPLTGEP